MKFRNEKQYNAHVDAVIAGPLTSEEVEDLMYSGLDFASPLTLDTEYSLAALAAHPFAAGQTPENRKYFHGLMSVLEARLGVCGARSWDELQGIAAGVGRFTPAEDTPAVMLP